MPAGTGARPPWVSTHPVASSVVWVGLHPSGVQPSGVRATGCIVRVRPSSGLVSARPSGRVRLVPRPAATLGNSSVQRGSLTTATGRAACGLPRPGRLGRRPRRPGRGRHCPGRALVSGASAADWPDCTQVGAVAALDCRADRPGQPTVRAPAAGGYARAGERAAARRCCTCRVAGHPGLDARLLCVVVAEPGARSGRPGRATELAGEDGVRPQRGPGVQRAFPARRRHRCDLREWWWARQGLNLWPLPCQEKTSLKGFAGVQHFST
jgi:hypothetical protein